MTKRRRAFHGAASIAVATWTLAAGVPALRGQGLSYPPGVQRVVESAQAQGLPPGSILTKVALGVQLHTPNEKIVTVAEAEATRLGLARTLLGSEAPDADLQAGASALSYKIPANALSAIRKVRPSTSVAVPLGVLTQLVLDGEPTGSATQVVVNVMHRGVNDAQLVALGEQIHRDVASGGMAIELAAELRVRGLTAVLASPVVTGAATVADPTTLGAASTSGTTVKPPLIKPPFVKPPGG